MIRSLPTRVSLLLLAGVVVYVATGIGVLHFGMAGLLFPHTPAFSGRPADSIERLQSKSGNELLIRRYGKPDIGCVVLFPGQHGYKAAYDTAPFTAAGLEVLLLAYPGQDGASGLAVLEEVEDLAQRAVHGASKSCPAGKVALLGVSLGSMLAPYSGRDSQMAGMVLVSAAPSLSDVIRQRLLAHWYTAPLSLLPLSRIVPHDYRLAEGLARVPQARVVIYQGTEDELTPLPDLERASTSDAPLRIVRIPGGTHATTFAFSQDAQVSMIAGMLVSSHRMYQ